MSEPTLAEQLVNVTPTVTLSDGSVHELSFDYEALQKIESRFGTVLTLVQAVSKPFGPRYFEAVFHGVEYGLIEAQSTIPDQNLSKLIKPAQMSEHGLAVLEGIAIAFPSLLEAGEKEAQKDKKKKGSTGKGRGTSQSSSAELVPASSGE